MSLPTRQETATSQRRIPREASCRPWRFIARRVTPLLKPARLQLRVVARQRRSSTVPPHSLASTGKRMWGVRLLPAYSADPVEPQPATRMRTDAGRTMHCANKSEAASLLRRRPNARIGRRLEAANPIRGAQPGWAVPAGVVGSRAQVTATGRCLASRDIVQAAGMAVWI